LLRFSRGFTQSQFNSARNKFIYTSKYLKTLRTIINSATKNTTTIPQLFYYLNYTAFPNPLLLHRGNRSFLFGKPRSRTTAKRFAICVEHRRRFPVCRFPTITRARPDIAAHRIHPESSARSVSIEHSRRQTITLSPS